MLIQANSGGGKSYAIRKVAETTHGAVQQIIIDVEGEFPSLREKFDYILIGKDGDISINLRSAELLAQRLLELNMSAIIDLYELKHHDRIKFVKLFFDSMINAPKELWHKCEIILDEGHIFAPEKGMGEAESADAVKDMATRGRKRGFALIVATQRLSKLDKNVVAELNTKLIGRSSLDVDMKRSAFELGFTQKEDIFSLRTLQKGEFYAFGPGLSDIVTKIKIDKVTTKHFETGSTIQKPSSPTDKIKQTLAKLADLPQEVEQELKTKQDLQKRINELTTELREVKRQQTQVPKIDPAQLQQAQQIGYQKGFQDCKIQSEKIIQSIKTECNVLRSKLNTIQHKSKELLEHARLPTENRLPELPSLPKEQKLPTPQIIYKSSFDKPPSVYTSSTSYPEVSDGKLTGPGRKILTAIAQRTLQEATRQQIALVSGYSIKSSGFDKSLSTLSSQGYIKRGDGVIRITEQGLAVLGPFEPLLTDSEHLKEFWCMKVGPTKGKILRVICEVWPNTITKEEVAEKTGYSVTSSGFDKSISTLSSSGLIERVSSQELKATKELFPE